MPTELPDDVSLDMEQRRRDGHWRMKKPRCSAQDATVPAAPGDAPQGEVRLPRDYLRRISRLEAMPENATGADKTWVHKAHADAVRHFDSAKRR